MGFRRGYIALRFLFKKLDDALTEKNKILHKRDHPASEHLRIIAVLIYFGVHLLYL